MERELKTNARLLLNIIRNRNNNRKVKNMIGGGYMTLPEPGYGNLPLIHGYSDQAPPVLQQIPEIMSTDNAKADAAPVVPGNDPNFIKFGQVGGAGAGAGAGVLASVSVAVAELSKLLAPLGVNALASLVVLLSFKLLGKSKPKSKSKSKSKSKFKSQKGGSLGGLEAALIPLGKNALLALASLLLLHYFSMPRRSVRVQKGGAVGEILALLAPVGASGFTATGLLTLLAIYLKPRKTGSRVQKGGAVIPEALYGLVQAIAPLGVSTFTATAVLIVLKELFQGGPKTKLLPELKNILKPLGLNKVSRLGLSKKRKTSKK